MRVDTPASVRADLVAEHDALRGAINHMQTELSCGDDRLVRSSGLSLLARRTSGMAAMDQTLGPILRGIDAWGPQRERALYFSHARQADELGQLDVLLRDPAAQVGAPLVAFLLALKCDLLREQDEFLSPVLLRDDPIVLDGFGG